MSFTFLTLALISFSCDLLKIFFRRVERPQEVKEMAEEAERRKVAVISTAIAAYTSKPPEKFIIRKITPEDKED